MDWACEDGIPGPELTSQKGRSCFKIRFKAIESIKLQTDPVAAHNARPSCLKIMNPPNVTATNHLLYNKIYKLIIDHYQI